ncbi:hypothetical protein EVAR_24601_1 [Eumeta japonica]|uniref:Uncharacterized protein n=1 Tax=Eumeta variegata TaxID=151549 RepID=A0A4C1W5B3_EUMVA|nr:hypothetical protein EVAR_24601_1 [Eumeta japonica]
MLSEFYRRIPNNVTSAPRGPVRALSAHVDTKPVKQKGSPPTAVSDRAPTEDGKDVKKRPADQSSMCICVCVSVLTVLYPAALTVTLLLYSISSLVRLYADGAFKTEGTHGRPMTSPAAFNEPHSSHRSPTRRQIGTDRCRLLIRRRRNANERGRAVGEINCFAKFLLGVSITYPDSSFWLKVARIPAGSTLPSLLIQTRTCTLPYTPLCTFQTLRLAEG